MLQKLKGNNSKGFTLIELMIVIAIIGVLAAIAIPNFIAYRNKSYCNSAESDANNVAATISDYFAIPENTTLITTTGATQYMGFSLTNKGWIFPKKVDTVKRKVLPSVFRTQRGIDTPV
jgi:prepilin-type N-terminal cleavage/methylation domain-containing protein